MTLTIPGYEVFESIGEGGMAQVYRACHIRLDREVALKVMLSRFAKDPSFGDRFIREARIAANLNHPNIVQIYDVNRFDDTLFLSMEFVKGGDLTAQLREPLTKTRIANIIRDLSQALDYAHGSGYIHRDIKPANVLFRENGTLALSDFGIARAIHSDTHMTQTGMVVGTPSYMSPEQAQGKPLTGSSDLYSVAVIAYQLVTGKLPYQSESSISVAIKHISDPIPRVPTNLGPLQPFFNQALAKEQGDRFENGEIMAEAFAKALENVKDFSWCSLSEEETLALAAPGETYTHSDFEAFTLENDGISELETEVVAGGGSGNNALVRTPRSPQRGAEETTGLSGEIQREPHSTVQLVFLQINRIKVFITQSNKHLALALIVIGLLFGGSVIYLAQNYTLQDKKSLSPGQQIRIAQLLTHADQNLKANQLVAPLGDNAYEKYLAILAISPKDPVALEGIQKIAILIESQVLLALDNDNISEAEQALSKLQEFKSEEKRHTQLALKISDKEKNLAKQVDHALSLGAQAESVGEIETAIGQYEKALTLSKQAGKTSIEAETALSSIAKRQIEKSRAASKQNQFSDAEKSIELAKKATQSVNNDVIKQEISNVNAKISKTKKTVHRQNQTSKQLATAKQALASGRIAPPDNNNAYDIYRAVLKSQPNNREANNGLKTVYSTLEKNAAYQINVGNLADAKTTLDTLTQLNPGNSKLPELNSALIRAQRQEKKDQAIARKVSTLYERSATYLKNGRAKSADKIYTKIQRLAPSDPGLKGLGLKIADSYTKLAQKAADANHWRDVSVWVDRGLRHAPQHQQLLELKTLADKKLNR